MHLLFFITSVRCANVPYLPAVCICRYCCRIAAVAACYRRRARMPPFLSNSKIRLRFFEFLKTFNYEQSF
ncbi:hypothetical protein [Methanimicrococcus blatticola]|uniref:hypothetical protein n=1 Tax=Methanimicrococcus blatticola TaxID=91560 RepID=UPI0010611630|nr:hypothetical protein [Methanimicrococcus blatticola]MBZ3936239.1 hypothetical protein [Methanimicrococcus blatticola]MCC2508243.1 hypothetical protein [Methanimicrococcus blatticola]